MSKLAAPCFNSIDRWIAGRWYWLIQRKRAEERLNRVLVEGSLEDERAYRSWTNYEFACKFGRTAPYPTRCLIEAASREGIDKDSLALLVINRDVEVTPRGVLVHRGALRVALTYAVRAICVAAILIYGPWLVLLPVPLLPKLLAALIAVSTLVTFAYVMNLYTGRPLAAARGAGDDLIAFADGAGKRFLVGARPSVR